MGGTGVAFKGCGRESDEGGESFVSTVGELTMLAPTFRPAGRPCGGLGGEKSWKIFLRERERERMSEKFSDWSTLD